MRLRVPTGEHGPIDSWGELQDSLPAYTLSEGLSEHPSYFYSFWQKNIWGDTEHIG